jgi:hypothetical protein
MRLLLSIGLLLALKVSAATWYFSSSGSSTNGTLALPWSPEYAATSPYVAPGDQIVAIAGGSWDCDNYDADLKSNTALEWTIDGEEGNPIIIRPQTWLGFRFRGYMVFKAAASHLRFDGFEVTCTATDRHYDADDRLNHSGGIWVTSQDVDIANCYVHDIPTTPVFRWKGADGSDLTGNLVLYCGGYWYDDPTSYANGTPVGSALYTQNTDGNGVFLIGANITLYSWTSGGKVYTSGGNYCDNVVISENIAVRNHQEDLFWHADSMPSTPPVISRNVTHNYNTVDGIRLGYHVNDDHPHWGALVSSNYICAHVPKVGSYDTGGLVVVDGWSNLSVSNNVVVKPPTWSNGDCFYLEDALDPSGYALTNTHHLGGNTYYAASAGEANWQIKGAARAFAQWKSQTTSDSSSSAYSGLPAANVVRVIQPPGQSERLHVAVMNWIAAATESIPVAGYFSDGDTIRVWDIGRFPTAQADSPVVAGAITVDLTATAFYTPMGGVNCYTGDKDGYSPDTWAGLPRTWKAYVLQKVGGLVPVLGWGPTELVFDSLHQGSTRVKSVSLTNVGSGILAWSIGPVGDFSAAPASGVLSASQYATVSVTYAPGSAGSDAESLTIVATGDDGAVACSGSATNFPAHLVASPSSWNAGPTHTNTSASKDLTLTNTGEENAPWSVSASGGPWTGSDSGTIPPGNSDTFTVTFTPTVLGISKGSYTVTGGGGINIPTEGSGTENSNPFTQPTGRPRGLQSWQTWP